MKISRSILLSLLFIIGAVFLSRAVFPSEVDDLHPDIQCEKWIIDESEVLWVIPLLNNNSIGSEENKEWCENLDALNKTLGLHGVYHTYREFNQARDGDYLINGINAFEQCLGESPKMFKAPQVKIVSENLELLNRNGMKYHGNLKQVLRKVYHCEDTGMFPNWAIKIF